MWPARSTSRTVTCIACGRTIPRHEAREYDKHGDRWEREDKEFEYLCKPCFGDISKQSRDDLEETLVDLDAGDVDREEFLRRYVETCRDTG